LPIVLCIFLFLEDGVSLLTTPGGKGSPPTLKAIPSMTSVLERTALSSYSSEASEEIVHTHLPSDLPPVQTKNGGHCTEDERNTPIN